MFSGYSVGRRLVSRILYLALTVNDFTFIMIAVIFLKTRWIILEDNRLFIVIIFHYDL